jgi:hypothetical protein
MRKIRTLLLALTLGLPLLAGCHLFGTRDKDKSPINVPTTPDTQPTTTSLVNYLNLNCRRINSVQANLTIGAKMGLQAIDISGGVAARRPRELRLRGKVLGRPAVDLGSNDQEFWYWISQAEPPHYYKCSYKDLATGRVNVPFPVETDMVMAALNMAEYDTNGKYDLKQNKDGTWELTQDTTSGAGRPIKRGTVFRGVLAKPGEPQVLEHTLRDAKGNLVCKATVQRVEFDKLSGAVVPTRLTIEYPSQKVRLKLELNDLQVNKIDDASAKMKFSLQDLGDHTIYDLARGAVVGPSSQSRASVQPRR